MVARGIMAGKNTTDLTEYFKYVQQTGKLPTIAHAQRWSNAVLWTLGLNLDGSTKRQLAKVMPQELAHSLTRAFWLLHFRNKTLSSKEFQNMVSRRSGNSDPQFAKIPVLAVFGGVKKLIDAQTSDKVAQTLAPEIRELWKQA